MFVSLSMRRARKLRPLLLSAVPALLVAGCTLDPPKPPYAHDPADAAQATPPVPDSSVLDGYVGMRPVLPDSWLELNRRVTPPVKP
ncbi:MAG: hypothetical protein AB7G15_00465 [Alphaproteobacteria bacterium]